jgi:hypothetical protein
VLKKISILTALAFAGAIFAAAPVRADGLKVHTMSGDVDESFWHDADRIPDHRRDLHIGENLIVSNVDHVSTFEDVDSDSSHSKHGFSGVPNTAEWIWWLNDWDKKKKKSGDDPNDPLVPVPEPASLFLLGSGVAIVGAWRRRATRSASIS